MTAAIRPLPRPHDLGGKPGFGAIATASPPFAHDWERRMWAVAKHSFAADWTLDWWRHMAERMAPETYASLTYFEKWCLNYATGFVSSGVFSAEEILSGTTSRTMTPPPPSGTEGALRRLIANEAFFDRPAPVPPRLAIGDLVHTRAQIAANHTRLPGYAMAKAGRIIAHHGAHLFADRNAEGIAEAQHLYSVEFRAGELWGAQADPRDSVVLDLWESYFEL